MEHQKIPGSFNLFNRCSRLVVLVGVFFLGRFSYVNNTVNHDLLVGGAILAVMCAIYLLMERSVNSQVAKALDALRLAQAKRGRELIAKIDNDHPDLGSGKDT